MEAIFKICKNKACQIQVSGLERDSNQYLEEDQVSFRNYTFEKSMTLNVVTAIDSKENETLESYSFVPHTDIDIDFIEMKQDGFKQVDHFIIPTKEWLDYVLEFDPIALEQYSLIYYFDNDKFYKYIQGNSIEVKVEEIIEVNSEETTLIRATLHAFELCHLEQCLFKLGLYILDKVPCNDPCVLEKMKGYKADIFNRDIVWMALNVIKYCIEQQNFFKAQSILEQIETCWGICRDLGVKTDSTYSGCGCS